MIVRFIHFLVSECFLTLFQSATLLETILLHMCFWRFSEVAGCQQLWGDSMITSRPGGRWVYTFFSIFRDGKSGWWVVLD